MHAAANDSIFISINTHECSIRLKVIKFSKSLPLSLYALLSLTNGE
jgi:hypothetical protein